MTMQAFLSLGGHFQNRVTTDTSNATALIGANAANGLRLVATYAPDDPRANKMISAPLHIMRDRSIRRAETFTFMVFQRADDATGGGGSDMEATHAELETETKAVTIQYTKPLGSINKTVSGIDAIVAAIHELGRCHRGALGIRLRV